MLKLTTLYAVKVDAVKVDDVTLTAYKVVSFNIRPASSPGPTVTVAWVLRGKHSRKRAVGPGRKCRKKVNDSTKK